MMRLSKDRLRRMQKVWEDCPEGLTVAQFVKLFLDEVPQLPEEKFEMMHALIKLFTQIDINGDE